MLGAMTLTVALASANSATAAKSPGGSFRITSFKKLSISEYAR